MKHIQHSIVAVHIGLVLTGLVACSGPKASQPHYTWSPVEINVDIGGSQKVENIVAPYRVKLDSIMGEVIGYASHDLTTDGEYESTLGTFVTQLLMTQSASSFDEKVDIAIMNHHGGLRAPINQGAITLGEVFEVMPFENETVLLEIPGDSLSKVIQFIGKSGRSMIWPVSFEVVDGRVKNIRLKGTEIIPKKNYVLSVSDYIANGGSGFKMLKKLRRIEVQPIKLRDMIVSEIRQRTERGDSIKTEVPNYVKVSDS